MFLWRSVWPSSLRFLVITRFMRDLSLQCSKKSGSWWIRGWQGFGSKAIGSSRHASSALQRGTSRYTSSSRSRWSVCRSDLDIRRIWKTTRYTHRHRIGPIRISRSAVRQGFVQAGRTMRGIAVEVRELIPDLAPLLPPARKPWIREDTRSHVFDNTGLGRVALWRLCR